MVGSPAVPQNPAERQTGSGADVPDPDTPGEQQKLRSKQTKQLQHSKKNHVMSHIHIQLHIHNFQNITLLAVILAVSAFFEVWTQSNAAILLCIELVER